MSEVEEKLVRWIERQAARRPLPPEVRLGIGDDAASVLPRAGEELIVTTDIQIEGVHFRRSWISAYDLGVRLSAVNLSDIAAMGGRPVAGMLSIAVPNELANNYAKRLARGAIDELARYGASLIGGNVSGSKDMVACEMTVIGACKRGMVWRRACKVGDVLVVAGHLGSARAGLRLLETGRESGKHRSLIRSFVRPEPRLDVANLLRKKKGIHGAIDVSDGFSADVVRLCKKSGVGCEIEGSRLPISPALVRFCKEMGEDPRHWALAGGEDYALILALDPKGAEAITRAIERSLRVPCKVVGKAVSRKRCELLIDGKRRLIRPEGWDHFGKR